MVASIRIRVLKNLALLCLALAFTSKAAQRPGEWTGDYSPCDRHTELLQRMHMDLGVRFATSNQELAVEFARAMNFWATILDMNWHQENSRNCAIQVVDGSPGLFKPAEIARAQFLDSPSFQGWIAFNPRASLSANELFLTAVHELGLCWAYHTPKTHLPLCISCAWMVPRSSMMPISRRWRVVTSSV